MEYKTVFNLRRHFKRLRDVLLFPLLGSYASNENSKRKGRLIFNISGYNQKLYNCIRFLFLKNALTIEYVLIQLQGVK